MEPRGDAAAAASAARAFMRARFCSAISVERPFTKNVICSREWQVKSTLTCFDFVMYVYGRVVAVSRS